MKVHLSGIQPSGRFHLGNYIGCLKPFIDKQNIHPEGRKNIFLIADMHCFTKPDNCSNLRSNVLEAVRSLLALGIDPNHVDIVQQSQILEHSHLAWYLSCLTKFSRAENMTQFKANREKYTNVGMFTYPILQAADILLYSPDYVLVGPDQKQHLELVSELCDRLEKLAGKGVVKRPTPLINNIRVMSLDNETKKMSKSEPESCLFLADRPDVIHRKIIKAKTDSITGITYDITKRKALANLIHIYRSFSEITADEASTGIEKLSHREFKELLSNTLSKKLEPFRLKYSELTDDKCLNILEQGTQSVKILAKRTLSDVMNKAIFI